MLDYVDGKLAGEKLHCAEHHLIDCEFCSEAVEGLKQTSAAEAKEILETTDEKVYKSIQPKKESAIIIRRWLAFAAVFLVLIAGSFYLNHFLHQKNKQIVQDVNPPTVTAIRSADSAQEFATSESSTMENKITANEPLPPPESKKSDTKTNSHSKNLTNSTAVEKENFPVTASTTQAKSLEEEQSVTGVTMYDNKTQHIPSAPPNPVSRQENSPVSSVTADDSNPETSKGKKTGIDYYYENNFSEALKIFAKQYNKDNTNLEAAYYAGVCELRLKEYIKAISYFNIVLVNPLNAYYSKAEWQKSLALLSIGDKFSAKDLLNKIISEGKEFKDSAQVKLLQTE